MSLLCHVFHTWRYTRVGDHLCRVCQRCGEVR